MPAVEPQPSDIEIEWQFDALDLRPVERWLAALPEHVPDPAGNTGRFSVDPLAPKRLVDGYMDTDDWRVGRSGFVLRVRRKAGGSEATLKDTAPAEGGLRRRLEVTEALGPGGLSSLKPDGPVGRRMRALAGNRPLHQVLEVRTRRRPYVLRLDGQEVAEIALDETVIDVADGLQPVRLRRVEVEVQSAWVEHAAELVSRLRRECGLQPAALSKFEAGLLASGRQIPTAPDLGPVDLSPAPTIADVAFVVMRRNLEVMLRHEPGTRLGEDAEALHDMRVATRRLRAALAQFADVLPVRARQLRAELGWLADALGEVRDLDVQLERVAGWSEELPEADRGALAELRRLLDGQRGEARERLLHVLDSSRYERLVTGFEAMLRQGPLRRSAPGRAHAMMVVPDLLRAQHRAVTKAAKRVRRSGAPEDFHRLRIRCKRLRYAMEFVSDLYPGQTGKYVKRVVAIQDTLGVMQDAQVAATRLRSLCLDERAALSRATVFVLGGVADRYRREARRLGHKVPSHLDELTGAPWQRLMGHVDQRRLEIAPIYGWTAHLAPPAPPASAAPAAANHASADMPPTSALGAATSVQPLAPRPEHNGHNGQRSGNGR